MNKTQLSWEERPSELESIASVLTGTASEITPCTVLAGPCISIILVKSKTARNKLFKATYMRGRALF